MALATLPPPLEWRAVEPSPAGIWDMSAQYDGFALSASSSSRTHENIGRAKPPGREETANGEQPVVEPVQLEEGAIA
jgi:hypothetical protein